MFESFVWIIAGPDAVALLTFTCIVSLLLVTSIKTMPSVLSSSPFLSLRPDHDCGRHKEQATDPVKSFASINGSAPKDNIHGTSNHNKNAANGANGFTYDTHSEDEFLRLSSPQQDVLLLHGPRQKYSLERARDIPECCHFPLVASECRNIVLYPL